MRCVGAYCGPRRKQRALVQEDDTDLGSIAEVGFTFSFSRVIRGLEDRSMKISERLLSTKAVLKRHAAGTATVLPKMG